MDEAKVIRKVWGEEHWIINREYAGKKMVLYSGRQCSLHFHKKKEETFYVMKGAVLMECMGERRIMYPGDSQLILPNTPHRFTGLSEESAEIIEFSTHHYDELDTDNYRLVPSKVLVREPLVNNSVYITGDRGYLGRAIRHGLAKKGLRVSGSDIEFVDITNQHQLESDLREANPKAIIHAAALSDWGACEKNPELAHRINVDATRNIVNFCHANDVPLIYVSTDFVFSGKSGNYDEDFPTDPINVYGRTKVLAEDIVRKLNKHIIIRAGTFYGVSYWIDRPVFAHKLLRSLESEQEYEAAIDEYSNPTLIQDLESAAISLLDQGCWGTWHAGGVDRVSRYEFASKIARTFNLRTDLIISSKVNASNRTLNRPADVSLSMRKLNSQGLNTLSVEEGLMIMKSDYDNRESLLKLER